MEKLEFVACRRHSVCYENMIFFLFKDRMNHLESQQKYEKKRLSTHTMHFVEMEKVYLRNDDYL